MGKKSQQLLKGKRVDFPLATGAASHVALTYDGQNNPYLLCYTSPCEPKPEFTVALSGCRIINNITEIGPCIHIITKYEEYQFQCRSQEEFEDLSEFFGVLGFQILKFRNVYVLDKKIGNGSFSTAYIGTNTLYGNKVVIKEVDKSKVKESNVYTEIEVLRKVMHKYIIKLISAYEQEGYVYLVLEYLRGGELFEYLNTHGPYTERNARKAMHRVLVALEALHSNGVVHRDLKMENLMLEVPNDPCSLKIIDLGLASFLNTSTMNMRCGSPGYVAPEILKYAPYGTKVDIFSLGVILFNILCGYPPFRGSNVKEIFKKNMRCHISFNSKHWADRSESVKEIILWMCNPNPDERCTAKQALGHAWFFPKLTSMGYLRDSEELKLREHWRHQLADSRHASLQGQGLLVPEVQKKCKYYNIDSGNEHEQLSESVKTSRHTSRSYKKYFDTTLRNDDKSESKMKNGGIVNQLPMHRKRCEVPAKNLNEYETIPLHGRVPASMEAAALLPRNARNTQQSSNDPSGLVKREGLGSVGPEYTAVTPKCGSTMDHNSVEKCSLTNLV